MLLQFTVWENHNTLQHYCVNLTSTDTKTTIYSILEVDMFQRKIDEIFRELLNVYCITDNMLIVGYDDNRKDHNRKLCREL